MVQGVLLLHHLPEVLKCQERNQLQELKQMQIEVMNLQGLSKAQGRKHKEARAVREQKHKEAQRHRLHQGQVLQEVKEIQEETEDDKLNSL